MDQLLVIQSMFEEERSASNDAWAFIRSAASKDEAEAWALHNSDDSDKTWFSNTDFSFIKLKIAYLQFIL